MKTKFFIIIAIFLAGFNGFSQKINQPKEITDLLTKYHNMKDVTVITMNNDMFKTFKDDSELNEISFNFDKFQILTTESKAIVSQMKQDFKKLIQNGILIEMMSVKDDGSQVLFLIDKASQGKTNVTVFFMIVEEVDEYVIMYFSGNIPIEEIKELENQ